MALQIRNPHGPFRYLHSPQYESCREHAPYP